MIYLINTCIASAAINRNIGEMEKLIKKENKGTEANTIENFLRLLGGCCINPEFVCSHVQQIEFSAEFVEPGVCSK